LVGCIGFLISFVGLFISCWSGYLLGKNSSLSVHKKVKHELIKSGPYSILRHPIYTELLLISIGNTFFRRLQSHYCGNDSFLFLLVQTKKRREMAHGTV
jgi:protein-S-isoprenylcysteine O-methyltransferase Ste14